MPRRPVQIAVVALLLLLLATLVVAFTQRHAVLDAALDSLDLEREIADPQALIVGANLRTPSSDARIAEIARAAGVPIVVLGRPFSPDTLAPATDSPRADHLVAAGVPRERIVAVPEGEDLYESLAALAVEARARGWRRVQFVVGSGGSRRVLLAADRILGGEGIAVGQILVRDPEVGDRLWWADTQWRTQVFYNWMLLFLGRVSGRL